MSTDVATPNLPPALRTQVYEAIGAASMQWENIDQAGVFKSTEAAQVAGELCAEIARVWDAREAPLLSHLRNLSYNLGQLRSIAKTNTHLEAAQDAVDNVLRLLEQPR